MYVYCNRLSIDYLENTTAHKLAVWHNCINFLQIHSLTYTIYKIYSVYKKYIY